MLVVVKNQPKKLNNLDYAGLDELYSGGIFGVMIVGDFVWGEER